MQVIDRQQNVPFGVSAVQRLCQNGAENRNIARFGPITRQKGMHCPEQGVEKIPTAAIKRLARVKIDQKQAVQAFHFPVGSSPQQP